MTTSYPEMVSELTATLRQMHKGIPETMRGFGLLADHAKAAGVLDAKTKELLALAIGIAMRCDGCIGFHARGALRAGATRAEALETIGVAIMMGGGPATIYGAHALQAFDQFAAGAP
ncbi:MAG: carboxymuconolactone decarboxylase family protein [Rhodospirillales bacterium]|jgi:AhpD family alkylhydroperoxidase|nr:carboxymuconolactone decarboxylase family protein [Rhodospirillales bacterium]